MIDFRFFHFFVIFDFRFFGFRIFFEIRFFFFKFQIFFDFREGYRQLQ